MSDVLVVGAGLVGTSVALALRDQADVTLADLSPEHLKTAVARGAGRAWNGRESADLVMVATSPGNTGAVLLELIGMDIGQTYTHVASVQSQSQREVEARYPYMSAVLGSHPIAGREVGGPGAADAGLFVGRQWAVCRWAATTDQATERVLALVRACGAEPVLVSAGAHDEAVALASHLPHLSSALLAGLLVDGQAAALSLAGPGLMDTTRLAAGDSELWREILTLNASHVAVLARLLGDRLQEAASLLEQAPDRVDSVRSDALRDLLDRGRRGRALVPVKHGLQQSGFRQVTIVLDDAPGQLAGLLQAAAAEQVNIEDVRVDHAFGHRAGRVGLWVTGADQTRLTRALVAAGWRLEEEPPEDIGSTL